MAFEIRLLPVMTDNYIFILHDSHENCTIAVDPGEAEATLAFLGRQGAGLDYILNTHHHHDHTGGNLALKRATGAKVIGARRDAGRIPGLDLGVDDNQTIRLGSETVEILAVPGHTSGHLAYWLPSSAALFCGDTLFSLGCGRMFEGTPEQFWRSLTRLRALPDAAQVFCAHEYTASNARFALSVEPDNRALIERVAQVTRARDNDEPTIPSAIGVEKAANPFLRADLPALASAVKRSGAPAHEVFGALRALKDRF